MVKNTANNIRSSNYSNRQALDLVIRGSDHQNYVDVCMLATRYLMHQPAMLGPQLDCFATLAAIDEILPAFFLGANACASYVAPMPVEGSTVGAPATVNDVDLLVDSDGKDTVDRLICVCGEAVGKETMEFIRENIMHVSQLSGVYAPDFAGYNRTENTNEADYVYCK